LAEAGALLASSLDYQETLKRVANLAVPHIADWCAVDLVNSAGEIERLAVAHVDPAKIELARRLQTRYPVDPDSPYSVQHVVRTGRPAMLSYITDEMIVAAAHGDKERIELTRALGITSYMCVPLLARDR